ncbi:hypothetical protein [Cohnella cellulosilytica]|uniref:Uncharacterized protein n=1 Tax=Cohnella cellulosilytica TaxID=986710 RepID=A0ABW2FKP4_9BACL
MRKAGMIDEVLYDLTIIGGVPAGLLAHQYELVMTGGSDFHGF